jgi:dienelactone hydrolase
MAERRIWTVGWMAGAILSIPLALRAGSAAEETRAADAALAAFFAAETARLEQECLADIRSCEEWEAARGGLRERLFEMLGLDPLADRKALDPVVTGRLERDGIVVEKIHFQSRPGLYVTGNLYLPPPPPSSQRTPGEAASSTGTPGEAASNTGTPGEAAGGVPADARAPAVLYLCGHARVAEEGVSLGNKTHYQHHGAWLARHGYVALIVDTLQLGEIEGVHHGTYREGRWWWPSRGYTPAGVEAWNALVAIDYLASRPEVDPERIGVTGRSGGGATSWWTVALDESVKAAAPVAGITDLRDHVVNGCVSGHCDCMYLVNTYRWDYPAVAALAHPRPLLLANTDRDGIFPLGGVMRTHERVARLYGLGGRPADFGLALTPGGHVDSQEIQLPVIRWFDAHLGVGERPIDAAARRLFEPRELKVFAGLPADERNTSIDESFVPKAGPFPPPASAEAWRSQAAAWRTALAEKTFRGWPQADAPPRLLEGPAEYADGRRGVTQTADGLVCRSIRFESQPHVEIELILMHRADLEEPELVVLDVVDEEGWGRFEAVQSRLFGASEPIAGRDPADASADGIAEEVRDLRGMLRARDWAVATLAPRGVGPTRWNADPRSLLHNRRRFLLLGQTWEGMQAYDIRRGLQALRAHVRIGKQSGETPVWVQAKGGMAVLAAHASLFEPPVARLDLHEVPASHDRPEPPEEAVAPALLNVLRTLDVPQALALAADRSRVVLTDCDEKAFAFVKGVAAVAGWPEKQVQFRSLAAVPAGPGPHDAARSGRLSFRERVIDPRAGEVCYAVTLADVDGDARDDIVVVTEEAVVWYRNPGGEAAADADWEKRDIVRGRTPRDNVCIAAHDIDGDGAVDFALGAGWTGNCSLHWLTRDGSPERPWRVHAIGPLPSTHRMRWADVLGTGRPQLVVSPLVAAAGEPGVPLSAYAVPARPTIDRWPATVLDRSMNRMHGHAHVDLDGDGRLDTLTASREGVHVVRRSGDGRDAAFAAVRLARGAEADAPDACGAGEVEHGRLADGTPIIATVEPMHGTAIAVYTPARAGSDAEKSGPGPWQRRVIDEGYARGHAIVLADLDGDGGDEIVFGSSDPSTRPGYGPTLAVYALASGGASFAGSPADSRAKVDWHRINLDSGGVAVEAVAVGDLTGDSRPDIVAVGRATHNVKLFVNTCR